MANNFAKTLYFQFSLRNINRWCHEIFYITNEPIEMCSNEIHNVCFKCSEHLLSRARLKYIHLHIIFIRFGMLSLKEGTVHTLLFIAS